MNLSKYLVPIIYKKDMDKEATKFLLKYCPEALDKPMPIPVEDIAELEMNLEIDYVNIDRNYDILGMMIFSDGVVELYDKEENQYIRRKYNKGTLLVESGLSEPSNRGRERFTIAHEIVHWEKHQLRFITLSYKDKRLAKACRCPKEKPYKPKTPDEWVEWQADNLAAAILMPSDMFKKRIEELKKTYKAGKKINDFMWKGYSLDMVKEFIINELASTFQVSKQAAEIRLNTLGILL
ncbi:ImmA/IrrE family metallo-endopeptidase [Clostridium sporogenes]|uniref:ImmA/IrrE family metallo-endopeptidase n=1 Tax=Clostridium sporogenes TaxID=1509 RepID=UPI001F3C5F6F|nr:ImmA/IrrE family metallo-endopeptidase [Clostridium sporogenes]UJA31377.1 ImmA/IrrE family metallo-endopeptidase [Clostridium sporogenes]